MQKNRVVVTGLGVVSSVGVGKDEFWKSVISGKSGITKVSFFDTKEFRCHYAGEIKQFQPQEYISKRRLPFLGRTSQLTITAATLAFKDAKLLKGQAPEFRGLSPKETGIIMGTTMGERPLEESIDTWVREGYAKISKSNILQSQANNISTNLGIYFKITGINYLIPTACAAGNYAIGYGFDLIKSGELKYVLAGGADAFSKVAFSGFHRLYAMAPEKCQPFDKNRKGIIVGEGAGVLLLENLNSALSRKAEIYAEIVGYGLSCDAQHMTAPQVRGVSNAMLNALKESGINKEDVNYISAHGTGTLANDKTESLAIKNVFQDNYKNIAVSSLKSMIGHSMGAASAIEAIATCLAVKEDIIPPTINYETADPDCDIDCVPNFARKKVVNIALKNGFAFGGNNATLVIKKYAK